MENQQVPCACVRTFTVCPITFIGLSLIMHGRRPKRLEESPFPNIHNEVQKTVLPIQNENLMVIPESYAKDLWPI